jgi:kynurenine formamidase
MGNRYDGSGASSPQWWPSRYGAGDELGSLNEINEQRTLAAIQLPRTGEVLPLAQVLMPSSPAYGSRYFRQIILAHETLHSPDPDGSAVNVLEELQAQTYHMGCHVDGLGHIGIDQRFYNGIDVKDFLTPTKLLRYGAEKMKPWVTRGVLLDIAGLEGTETLPAGFAITVDHVEEAQRRIGVEVGPGDVVLFNTGWGKRVAIPDGYAGVQPGCGWEAAHWLSDRRVSAVGADNWGFECVPFQPGRAAFTIHQHLIVETGTYIIENLDLDALVASGRGEFLFVMSPNRVEGATGSMVNPLAIL